MIGDLYPRRAVATVAGMGGMAGALGGIAIAQATGWTLQLTGSYLPILLYAGLAYLIALGAIQLLVPHMEPIFAPSPEPTVCSVSPAASRSPALPRPPSLPAQHRRPARWERVLTYVL